jgi:hypothetical protein
LSGAASWSDETWDSSLRVVLVGGPGDVATGICTGGLGRVFAGILPVCRGEPAAS